MTTQHTPTPWELCEDDNDELCVVVGAEDITGFSPFICKTWKAVDAAFIVRARNAHEALIEALEVCELRLTHLATNGAQVKYEIEVARAALAKAEWGTK